MTKYKVCYIGNLYNIPEEILFHPNFELRAILYEAGRLTDELLTFAYYHHIKLAKLTSPNEILQYKKEADCFVMCSYGRKIPVDVTEECEIYNIHYGILPDYKGRHPSYYAFLNNEKHLGITLHRVNSQIDDGQIISTYRFENRLNFTESDLFNQQINKTSQLLSDLYEYKKKPYTHKSRASGKHYAPVTADKTMIDLQNDSIITMINKSKAQARYGGSKLIVNQFIFMISSVSLSSVPIPDNAIPIQNDLPLFKDNQTLYFKKEGQIIKLYINNKEF